MSMITHQPSKSNREIVEELLKEAINDFDMAKASAGREVSFSYWFREEVIKALDAKDAERDKAVEDISTQILENKLYISIHEKHKDKTVYICQNGGVVQFEALTHPEVNSNPNN